MDLFSTFSSLFRSSPSPLPPPVLPLPAAIDNKTGLFSSAAVDISPLGNPASSDEIYISTAAFAANDVADQIVGVKVRPSLAPIAAAVGVDVDTLNRRNLLSQTYKLQRTIGILRSPATRRQ
ncbi:unnamed protein product [Linum trigynum]|uniref:Uncharacterized protein n=1 Tax=Linum trigynum TaxID=586398 RepID=A0AAV2CFY1_9ROSI